MSDMAEQRLRAALLVQRLHAAIKADDGPFAGAHRKILDLHAPYTVEGDRICQTCLEGSHLYAEVAYPCPTLFALAEAYGIEVTT